MIIFLHCSQAYVFVDESILSHCQKVRHTCKARQEVNPEHRNVMLKFESVSTGNQRSGNGTQRKKQSSRPAGPAIAVFQVLCEEISVIGRNHVQRLYTRDLRCILSFGLKT